MSRIEAFVYADYEIRAIVGDDGEPWLVARDICEVLDIRTNDALGSLDEDEKGYDTVVTLGGPQQMAIVNEPGFYSLVLRSRKPEAKPFRRWVTHEVIPAIRRTGTYHHQPTPPSRKELAQWVVEAEERAELAEKALEESETYAKKLEPFAGRWMAMMEVEGVYEVKIAAAILSNDPNINIGQNNLFKFMARHNWIHRGRNALGSEIWIPYRTKILAGYLQAIPYNQPVVHPKTGNLVSLEPKVGIRWKGIDALHPLLGGTGPKPSRLAAAPDGGLRALPPAEEA